MAQPQEYFTPDKFYHIYNRGNAGEKIFVTPDNYNYFLSKYKEYIAPVANTYAYCLLPNHFHFLIQLKSEEELFSFLKQNKRLPDENITLEEFETLNNTSGGINLFGLHISKQFSNFFNGYSQAINKQQNRKGSLFQKNFKRKLIEDENYLKELILYIHLNPVNHQLVKEFTDWRYSSYHSFISELPTLLKRKEVLDMFDEINNFKYCHTYKNESKIAEIAASLEI
jgi:putative transposase